ncbi:MAG: Abi family protein, partial [Paludibacter sp.]
FTFRDALLLFNSLKVKKLKVDISQSFNVKWFSVLDNYLTRIITIRNICSHNNILFDHRFEKSIVSGPAITINNSNQFKLYSGIRLVNYLHNQLPFVEVDKILLEVSDLVDEFKNEDEKLIDILDDFLKV